MVQLKCLDTGEVVTLAEADRFVQTLSPIALQVIKRTNEFNLPSGASAEEAEDSDGHRSRPRRKTRRQRVRRMFSKAAERMSEAKDKALRKIQEAREAKAIELSMMEGCLRVSSHVKDRPKAFRYVRPAQSIAQGHTGAVWAMQFSPDGFLLATAGQDHLVKVWVLLHKFDEFQQKLVATSQEPSFKARAHIDPAMSDDLFYPEPLLEFRGHTADVLDVCWAPSTTNHVLLSSSMDMTVRLWHLLRSTPVATFPHEDFVTALAFHPKVSAFNRCFKQCAEQAF